MCNPVLRDYLGGVTPGEVYLFTTNGPSLKSHKRRKRLKAGPVKTAEDMQENRWYMY